MTWMTIQQVAQYLQLSEMMVYKLAQSGELPGIKIGRLWRFGKDQIDQWLMQKGKKTSPQSAFVETILQDFTRVLRKEFGDVLSQVWLFGSRARGDATPESDIDVLVVLKSITDRDAVAEKVRQIAYEVTFEKDRLAMLSAFVMDEKTFLTGNSPLLMNVRKEAKKAA